ncbi:Transmembrane protein 9, partial [Caligus rogercresseyi]
LLYGGAASKSESIHQDSRCLCKCPKISSFHNVSRSNRMDVDEPPLLLPEFYPSEFRTVYVNSSVRAEDCDCLHVVIPITDASSSSKVDPDTFATLLAVILVIWIIFVLVIYMGFLLCLDPLINKSSEVGSYTEQRDSDSGETPMRHYRSSVFQRIGLNQTRWKSQVQDQRRNIYDRHTMLN